LAEHRDKLKSWEDSREELERKMAAPWQLQHRGGGGGGRGAQQQQQQQQAGGANDLLAVLSAGLMPFGGGMYGAGDSMMMLNAYRAAAEERAPAWHAAGAAATRRGAAVQPPPPPPRNEYRVEVSGQHSTTRCAACNQAIDELTTRLGVRQENQRSWRWHHIDCLPAAHWRDARGRGVSNLRNVPPAAQALVRQHLQF
jgi:hypothetical protein